MFEDKQLENLCWDSVSCEEVEEVPSYTADFETTTLENDCRVWAWATCEIGNTDNRQYGNTIETFLEWCEIHAGSRVYFHNLKFDGNFILHHILSNGWQWIQVKSEASNKTFTTLISDMSQFYSIKLWFKENKAIEFLDSLKIIPLAVASIPGAFGLTINKLDLDYVAYREVGHILTDEEKDYISNDVIIVAQALNIMFEQGMKSITAGSNAFKDYQKSIGGKKRFRDWFPEPDYDEDLRKGGCYKGGFTAVNPAFAGKILHNCTAYDVNSLYPSVMAGVHGEVLPYGEPIYFVGKYSYDKEYPIYIQYIEADFTIKKDHIPSLQLKGNSRFKETEYIRDSEGLQTICLTSVDYELFTEQYDIHDIRFLRGYKFKGSTELFIDYVSKWTKIKTEATMQGNKGLRTIAKLQQNSLYGKTASNPVKQSRKPYLEDGIVKYALLPEEYTEPIYLPVAAFITAYARAFTIRAAQNNYGRWIYSDTDSCYFLGLEEPEGMKIDSVELGAWDKEHVIDRMKVIRAKTYCFEENNELVVHCAGMPTRCHKYVTMENFEYGASFEGKLKPKTVKGGTILEDTVFTIKR